MATKHPAKREIRQVVTTRSGEGALIGMVREKLQGGGVGIRLDFSTAPVPDRHFSADAAWVVCGVDMVRILFAQYKAAGPQIEHLVVVRVPFLGIRQFITSMEGLAPTGLTFLNRVNDKMSPPVDKTNLPDQSFTLDSNVIVAGFSGREACIDLYNSSPQVRVALLKGSDEFRAEPVARVLLTTRLLMDIYSDLAASLKTLPDDEAAMEVNNA